MKIENHEFELHYMAFSDALQELPEDKLSDVAYAFGVVGVPDLGNKKWEYANAIWQQIRDYRNAEERLNELRQAAGTMKRILNDHNFPRAR